MYPGFDHSRKLAQWLTCSTKFGDILLEYHIHLSILFESLVFPYHQISHNTDSIIYYTTKVLLPYTLIRSSCQVSGNEFTASQAWIYSKSNTLKTSYTIPSLFEHLGIKVGLYGMLKPLNLCTASNTLQVWISLKLERALRDTTYICCAWGNCSHMRLQRELVYTQKSMSNTLKTSHVILYLSIWE